MAFQKGHKNVGGRPPGALNKSTLTKLERRAVFEEKISQRWEQIIDQLPATYIADQYLGKAPEEHNLNVKREKELAADKIEEIDKIMFEDD